jgi:hypothetical protein
MGEGNRLHLFKKRAREAAGKPYVSILRRGMAECHMLFLPVSEPLTLLTVSDLHWEGKAPWNA